MSFYQFLNNVKIISGESSLDSLAIELFNLGGKNALLVSDKNLQTLGITSQIKNRLTDYGIKVDAVYIDIVSHATIENVDQMYQIYRNNRCDCIVACGGGSVIDSAKGLKLLITSQVKNLLECRGVDHAKIGTHVPFGVISTNAGTGRDVSKQASIMDFERNIMMDFETVVMQPDFSILAPQLTTTVSKTNTVMGFLDILAQGLEAYCGIQKNPISENFAISGFQLMLENYSQVLENPLDLKARGNIQQAQVMASLAFSNSKSGIMYSLAHAIGQRYNLEYSKVLSCVMVECLKFNISANKEKYAKLLFYFAGADAFAGTSAEKRPDKFIEAIQEFIEIFYDFGMPKYLGDLGLSLDEIDDIAQRAFSDSSIVTNARSLNLADIKQIITNCFKEVQSE